MEKNKATGLLLKCEKIAEYVCVDSHSGNISCNSRRAPNSHNSLINYEWQALSSIYSDEKKNSYLTTSGETPEEALKQLLCKLKELALIKSKKMMTEAKSIQDLIGSDPLIS